MKGVIRGLVGLAGVVALGAVLWGVGGRLRPYAPRQPIAFSHETHACKLGIDCQYCHVYADKSPHAGVPPVMRCVGCHRFPLPDSTKQKKVDVLLSYWNQKKPIAWIKVHDLPDYVYFSHKRHVKRGIRCQTCHGPVETMTVVEKRAPLTMGWCVSCHRKNNAPLECWTCHK